MTPGMDSIERVLFTLEHRPRDRGPVDLYNILYKDPLLSELLKATRIVVEE